MWTDTLNIKVKTNTEYVPRLYQICMINAYSTWAASTRAWEQHFYDLLLQPHRQSSIHHQSIALPSVNRYLFLCGYHMHVMFAPFIWCQRQTGSRLTASWCSFQSLIKNHLPNSVALPFCLSFFFSHPRAPDRGRWKKEKDSRKKEKAKVISDGCFVFVCHSQLLNFAF